MPKKHADIELGHSAYTDNDGLHDKVWLRKQAVRDLPRLSVLDLFAGDNLIWSQIKTDHYVGVEKERGTLTRRKCVMHLKFPQISSLLHFL